jgi:hypothetical protein
METFEVWCLVATFVASQAENCAVPTLKRRLAAIRKVHRLLRMENSVTGRVDPCVERNSSQVTLDLSQSSV